MCVCTEQETGEPPVVRASFLKRCTEALTRRLKRALRGTMELKTKAERSIASRFASLLSDGAERLRGDR